MRFKLDENLPLEIKDDLIALGHEADTVIDEGLAGASDAVVTQAVQRENRILLTMDKGIADVRVYPPSQYAGIVLFRPATQGRGATLSFVRRHLSAVIAAPIHGRLAVVSESGIRMR